jgi:hypothetical protein
LGWVRSALTQTGKQKPHAVPVHRVPFRLRPVP